MKKVRSPTQYAEDEGGIDEEELRSLYNQLEQNSSGELNRVEIIASMRRDESLRQQLVNILGIREGHYSSEVFEPIYQHLDIRCDGNVSIDEFIEYVRRARKTYQNRSGESASAGYEISVKTPADLDSLNNPGNTTSGRSSDKLVYAREDDNDGQTDNINVLSEVRSNYFASHHHSATPKVGGAVPKEAEVAVGFNPPENMNIDSLNENERRLMTAPPPWEEELPVPPSLQPSASQNKRERPSSPREEKPTTLESKLQFVPPTDHRANGPPLWVRSAPVSSGRLDRTVYSQEGKDVFDEQKDASSIPAEDLIGRRVFVEGFGEGTVKSFNKVDKVAAMAGNHSLHVIDFSSGDSGDEQAILLRRMKGSSHNNGYVFRLLDNDEHVFKEKNRQVLAEAERRERHFAVIRSMLKDCADKVVQEVFGLLSNGKQELVEDDFVDTLVAVPELRTHLGITAQDIDVPPSAGGSQYSAAFNLRQIFRQMDRSTSKASKEVKGGLTGAQFKAFFSPKVLSRGIGAPLPVPQVVVPNTPSILPPRAPPVLREGMQRSSVVSLHLPPTPKTINEEDSFMVEEKNNEQAEVPVVERLHETLHRAAQQALAPSSIASPMDENIGKVANINPEMMRLHRTELSGNVGTAIAAKASATNTGNANRSPTKNQLLASRYRNGRPRSKNALRVHRNNRGDKYTSSVESTPGTANDTAEVTTAPKLSAPRSQSELKSIAEKAVFVPRYMRATGCITMKYSTTPVKSQTGAFKYYTNKIFFFGIS